MGAKGHSNGAALDGFEAQQDDRSAERLARALGIFSLGLGAFQVVAPRRFARMIGVRGDEGDRMLVRLVGIRELVAGAGLLARNRPAGWLWARVAGDAIDLGLLGAAMKERGSERARVAGAMAAVLGVSVPDVLGSTRLSRNSSTTDEETMHAKAAITVDRPRKEVYGFWRDFSNFPHFMAHLESVEEEGGGRSRWRATAPAGSTVEWEAEIVEDVPNERISWRSLPDADVENAGNVRFVAAPGDRGTEIHVELRYDLPGSRLGALVAKLFGEDPVQQVKDDLRRFKQVVEVGEIVRSEASPEGVHAGRMLRQRPAQPLPESELARGGSR